ncbi:molybdenum ABC transporter ATP-binding protein [Hydrogenovibrio kuenenii]|uniref:molybdenum ABC transporter ATP-binding protein n=1 Tax=Hydrogenovibrio kuenenii TaxID=63658 RepID=UPI0004654BDD|nr:molybdenum ABC transporter ATP-binding protein [Hydrogenovibrio kuenenii]
MSQLLNVSMNSPSLSGHLSVQLGGFELQTGDFEIPLSGVTAIFGHSGSGKTTFIRCLAGFESAAKGEVTFGDQAWLTARKTLPIHKRGLGYVFQEASLFPHLNVNDNLLYGLKRASKTGKQQTISFEQVVEWLGLTLLLNRDVQTLSGGERQRVAIGRTLLSQPSILMMDEPMAALDLFSKRAIMPYLERLRDELDIPILYISHSPQEVERLADHVLFMEKGKIISIEPIEQALNREGTPLYQGEEPKSVMKATLVEQLETEGLSRVEVGSDSLYVPHLQQVVGSEVRLVIAAQQVSLMSAKPEQTSMLNHLPVLIESIEPHNDYSVMLRLRLAASSLPLLAQVTKRSVHSLGLSPGQNWVAAIKSVAILD